jgi:hypothetical protein
MRMNIGGVFTELTSLPGSSQVVVSHGVYLPEELRGQGIGTAANIERQRIAFDELGYDMMICTVSEENEAQIKVLAKAGWYWLTSFRVELWCCKAPESESFLIGNEELASTGQKPEKKPGKARARRRELRARSRRK